MQKLNYIRRLFATGASFTIFGVVGFLGSITVFPLIRLSSRDPDVVRRRAQRFNQGWFWLFLRIMRVLGCHTFEVRNAHLLQPGQLIVPNHPTLIDVVFMVSLLKEVDCIVKAQVRANPSMFGPTAAADYIANSDAEQVIDECVDRLGKGRSILIFPEGTRSVPGQSLKMQRGFARMAWRAKKDLTPVVITCDPPTLSKGVPWYRIPPRRFHMVIDVQPDIPLRELTSDDMPESVAVRRITRGLQNYYEEKLTARGINFPEKSVSEPVNR